MSNFPQQRNFRGKFNQIYISPLTQNRGRCKWLIWKSLNKNLPSFFITVINITIFNPNSASIYIKSFYYLGVSNRRGICPDFFHEQDSHFSKLDPREILKMQLVWQKNKNGGYLTHIVERIVIFSSSKIQINSSYFVKG